MIDPSRPRRATAALMVLAALLVASGLPIGCDNPQGAGVVNMPSSIRPVQGGTAPTGKAAPTATKPVRPLPKKGAR